MLRVKSLETHVQYSPLFVVQPTIMSVPTTTVGSESKSLDASSFAGRHVLVTGGSGYIGSHTVIELLQHGATCTIADKYVTTDEAYDTENAVY